MHFLRLSSLLSIILIAMSFSGTVAEKNILEVNAADYGFDEIDATQALQAAINSGAQKIIIPNMGKDWIVSRTIYLTSNQELYFEPGVVVTAQRGQFKGTNDALFRAEEQNSIILRGYGATLKMQKEDYMGPEYKKAEWRHVLSLIGCTDIQVLGITLRDSGGDGIYISGLRSGSQPYCKNVIIRDVVCDNNYRQGISVISAHDLLIENCILKNTSGTPPMAGIDFEPNGKEQSFINCIVRNCISENNEGYGFVISPGSTLISGLTPLEIKFENCIVRGCGGGIKIFGPCTGGPQGLIEFLNCFVEDTKLEGIHISSKAKSPTKLRFVNCIIKDVSTDQRRSSIYFAGSPERAKCLGGVEFLDCKVINKTNIPAIALSNSAKGIGLFDIFGNIEVQAPLDTFIDLGATESDDFKLDISFQRIKLDINSFFTETALPADNVSMIVRGSGIHLLYAEKDDKIKLNVTCRQLGTNKDNLHFAIVSPQGDLLYTDEVLPKHSKEITLTADVTGVFLIHCYSHTNAFNIQTDSPLGLLCNRTINLMQPSGDIYFWLPVGVSNTKVNVRGDGVREQVKATLFNDKGEIVEERDNISGIEPYNFIIERDETNKVELWSLRLEKASEGAFEDVAIAFESSVIPSVSFSPAIIYISE